MDYRTNTMDHSGVNHRGSNSKHLCTQHCSEAEYSLSVVEGSWNTSHSLALWRELLSRFLKVYSDCKTVLVSILLPPTLVPIYLDAGES